MGAYLTFKTNSNADKVTNYLIEESENNKKLIELDSNNIYINCNADIDWAKEEREDLVDMMIRQYGTGELKTSGFREIEDYTYEEIAEMWTSIFEELNKRFKMKYYARSCSLTTDYFTVEQMKRITNNGELLSGKSSSKDYVVEKYNELYELLKEPEPQLFDISNIKENDRVLVNGKWLKVQESSFSNNFRVQTGLNRWDMKNIEDIRDIIQDVEKYIPKIVYDGATVDIERYVVDNGTLVFLEVIGQEYMIKSISSVLMQGRITMNKHTVFSDKIGYFSINKAGNKRDMKACKDGIAHAIVRHAPSIESNDFNIIIGRTKDELLNTFQTWLEKSQPLPYFKDLYLELFNKFESEDMFEKITSYNIEALKIKAEIFENDYKKLENIIIDVCKENNHIDKDAKPAPLEKEDRPLPLSPMLTPTQVANIYDTLDVMPKTYELEDVKIKPVGLKLFTSSMTWYVVEADKGDIDDKYSNMQTQCFGYVKNESYDLDSEWGYINIEEVIKNGAEMDLYFEDMYIKPKGKLLSSDKVKAA